MFSRRRGGLSVYSVSSYLLRLPFTPLRSMEQGKKLFSSRKGSEVSARERRLKVKIEKRGLTQCTGRQHVSYDPLFHTSKDQSIQSFQSLFPGPYLRISRFGVTDGSYTIRFFCFPLPFPFPFSPFIRCLPYFKSSFRR